jgi:hypothetical protein
MTTPSGDTPHPQDESGQPWPIDPDDPTADQGEQAPDLWPSDPDDPSTPAPTAPASDELGESREPA